MTRLFVPVLLLLVGPSLALPLRAQEAAGEGDAIEAPFPDERYKVGARVLPVLVPTSPDDPAAEANRAAWQALAKFEKPFLTLFGDSDPVTAGAEEALQKRIPGARGQPHAILEDAGHFIQEDRGEELARRVHAFIESTPEDRR